MVVQRVGGFESFLAGLAAEVVIEGTFVGLFTEMLFRDMCLQRRFLAELLVAWRIAGALILSLLLMRLFMVTEPLCVCESFIASLVGACMIAHVCMTIPLVPAQVVVSLEGLVTSWLVADERPFSRVLAHMLLETARTIECLATAFVITFVLLRSELETFVVVRLFGP